MRPFGYDGSGDVASTGDGTKSPSEQADRFGHDAFLTQILFPELIDWWPVLSRLSIPLQVATEAAIRARNEGYDFQTALLASDAVSRTGLLHAIADELGLGAVEAIDPERIVIKPGDAITLLRGRNGRVPVKLIGKDGDIVFLITTERLRLAAMREQIARRPTLARHLHLVDPTSCEQRCSTRPARFWRNGRRSAFSNGIRPFRRISSRTPGKA